jgi:hypothetical protein
VIDVVSVTSYRALVAAEPPADFAIAVRVLGYSQQVEFGALLEHPAELVVDLLGFHGHEVLGAAMKELTKVWRESGLGVPPG